MCKNWYQWVKENRRNRAELTSTFPQVVKAVKMKRNPKPSTTTLNVLLSAMALSAPLHVPLTADRTWSRSATGEPREEPAPTRKSPLTPLKKCTFTAVRRRRRCDGKSDNSGTTEALPLRHTVYTWQLVTLITDELLSLSLSLPASLCPVSPPRLPLLLLRLLPPPPPPHAVRLCCHLEATGRSWAQWRHSLLAFNPDFNFLSNCLAGKLH